MEGKNLKGINFPGLNGTYFVAMNEFTQDAEYPGYYYRMVDSEKEWLNPPMVAGTEYRTTERHNGKVVYTKLIAFGNMPNSGMKGVPHGCAATNVLRVSGNASGSDSGATIPYYDGSIRYDVSATLIDVVIVANTNASANTAEVQIWYTKG